MREKTVISKQRPQHTNHVWSYDFNEDRTHHGTKYRMLNIIDEFTRKCLAIRIDQRLNSTSVIDILPNLFVIRDILRFIRSDNGPEFIAQALQDWITAVGSRQLTSHREALGRMDIAKASTQD